MEKTLIPIRPRNRDCIANQPPIPVHPLTDVNHCVHFRAAGGFNIGKSKCAGRIIDILTPSSLRGTPLDYVYAPLPEQVYLICDNLAYGCIPPFSETHRQQVTGRCYLAYLVPPIRQGSANELAPFHVTSEVFP